MRKLFFLFLSCLFVITAIQAQTAVSGVVLKPDTLMLYVDGTSVLVAEVLPSGASEKSVTWKSTAPDVIEIIESEGASCRIKALKSGKSDVVVTTREGNFRDTCTVIVVVHVEKVMLSEHELNINIGKDTTLIATIYPLADTNDSVKWTSADPFIVGILSTGYDTTCHIEALKIGTCKIYAETVDGGKKDSCEVTVDYVPVTGVNIAKDTLIFYRGNTSELTAIISPLYGTDDSITWTSTDSSVVDITSTGYDTICYIEALAFGEAKIYVTTVDGGFKDSCVVTVKAIPVTGIDLPEDSLELFIDNTFDLIATVTPSEASDKSVRWTSSDSSIVNILTDSNDSLCIIRGEALGMATIYAQTFDGEFKDSCVFTVKEQDVFAESDIETVDGLIDLYINIPENAGIAGSFELNLPKGFGLAVGESFEKTALTDEFEAISELKVTTKNDSTYFIEIIPEVVPESKAIGAVSKRKVMNIAYTVYDKDLEHSTVTYDAKLTNIELILSDDTEIDGEQIDFKIKAYTDETANENIGEEKIIAAYMSEARLFVNSSDAEVIYVYSLNGSLLFKGNKTEGQTIFNINTESKILIVRGSSGWVKKVVNQ